MPSSLPLDQKASTTLKLKAYCQGLIKVIDALTHINNTLAFWLYNNPDSLESDLLTKPSTLGTSIHQILQFFDEFHINKELLMSYVHCLIRFDMDYDKFVLSVTIMLEDIPAKIYKHSIQVPHITSLGWLFGMHEDLLLPSFESLLHDTIKLLAPNQSPSIQFGLTYKPIYNGTPHKEREKSLSWKMGHACGSNHQNCSHFQGLFKESPSLLCGQSLHQPSASPSSNPSKENGIEQMGRHKARDCSSLHSSPIYFQNLLLKISPLNWPLPALNNATLCTTLMAVMTADGKKLFLLVNPTRNGQGFNISYPMIYASQAHDFVEYLPAYLAHSHGTEVYHWFTPNTVTEAQRMGLDNKKINQSHLMVSIFGIHCNC